MQEYILNIETSTNVCSAAISAGERILAFRESMEGPSHAAMLTVFIGDIMKETGLDTGSLSAVAVSGGPGSYTGLRIGVSAAKGICYAADLPLIAVNSLAVMTQMVISSPDHRVNGRLLCPMIDARRMEVYTAVFNAAGEQQSEIKAEIINEETFRDVCHDNKLLIFGNGALKCRNLLNHPNIEFKPGIYPSARMMGSLSHKALIDRKFESTAYFTPFYLKDFVATTPRKKIF